MHSLRDLLDKKVALEAEIADRKQEAIATIQQMMDVSGVTVADMAVPRRGRAPDAVSPGSKRPVKYRNADGNTWAGVGQRPRWLRKELLAGKSLDDFAVRS